MNRAVSKVSSARMNREARKDQIECIVKGSTGNQTVYPLGITMTMVARKTGLAPSTHLLDILKELQIEGRILANGQRLKNGAFVWYWSWKEPQQLNLPLPVGHELEVIF